MLQRKRMIACLLVNLIVIFLLAGCGSGASGKDVSSPEANGKETSTEATLPTGEDRAVTEEEVKAAFEKAVPYDGEVKVAVRTSSEKGAATEALTSGLRADAGALARRGGAISWNTITAAGATSTLSASGYDYSVWNMLDWDLRTCWAEGNPNSEGTMEAFAFWMDETNRIDGFRIYPGYQKSSSVYRNNILPAALQVEVGGYEFWFDLDDCLSDLYNDGDSYWIDCTFSSPVYDDCIYVMIGAVATYGNDPDYDCCITEFHPFSY